MNLFSVHCHILSGNGFRTNSISSEVRIAENV